MKSIGSNVGKAGMSDQHQRGNPQDIERKNSYEADGKQQQSEGKDILPAEIDQPCAGKHQHEAHTFEA